MALPTLDECKPGLEPSEYNVLIAPEDAEQKTKGGIILIDSTKEANGMASMRGRLISVSPLAFTYEADWKGARQPQVNDVVLFAKYAGVLVEGADKREYRVCKDKDIMGIYAEGAQ